MSTPDWRDRDEPPQLMTKDLVIATLVGRWVERRERGDAPCPHDLVAVASEFGDGAVDELITVLAAYEAVHAFEDGREQ